jgi:aldehyde dehydrogenase (NAD+)
MDDAPLDVTARRIAWGRFMNAGQICVAPDYVLAPEALRSRLVESLRDAISRFYGEDPRHSPSYGRIVNQAHFQRLTALLAQGTIAAGGQFDDQDRYIAPTVITDAPHDSDLLRDEIFGPILPIVGYDSLEDALAFIRRRPKPLAIYAFTRNQSLQQRLSRELNSGSIVFNDVVMNQIIPGLPFGGVGNSGMGAFHGRYTFDAFSHAKAVLRRPFRADVDLRYPPFTAMKDRIMRWLISG